MGLGIIKVSGAAVRLWLQLPDGYRVCGFSFEGARDQLVVQVEAGEIPDVDEGCLLPVVTPVYSTDGNGITRLDHVEIKEQV